MDLSTRPVLGRFSADETFDIGMDIGSPVSEDYNSPNPFDAAARYADFYSSAGRDDKTIAAERGGRASGGNRAGNHRQSRCRIWAGTGPYRGDAAASAMRSPRDSVA
jgi:hypothetical protein